MANWICRLKESEKKGTYYEDESASYFHGKFIPKNKKYYVVVIANDNPDVNNINLELKLTRQALQEYRKRLPYDIKVYSILRLPTDVFFSDADITIEFIDEKDDKFLTKNVNAYGGYPNGMYKGKIVFNNSRIWWDGYVIKGLRATMLGLVDRADPEALLLTYNYKRTVKHEFMHVLGGEHTEDGVMSSFYNFDDNMLGKDSIHILEFLYGKKSVSKRWLYWIKAVMTRRQKF